MIDFPGRHRESAALHAMGRGPGSLFLPVYGRRRVGKSAMIVHFMEKKPGIYFVGKRAPGEMQIDVVGVRQDGWTDLGECKWKDPTSIKPLADELEAKIPLYPNQRNATISRRLFIRSVKSTVKLPGVRVHTLKDLYALKSLP